MNRRSFLQATTAHLAALAMAPLRPARAMSDAGPKVVIIRFGGGVRRLETIDPNHLNYTPNLFHRLLPEGTLWENVELEGFPTHSTGTINFLTGRYEYTGPGHYEVDLVPSNPTLFELARQHLGLPMHQALIVNNGSFTELTGWSDAPGYGTDFRPGQLSYPQFLRAHLEDLRDGTARVEHERQHAIQRLQDLDAGWYRPACSLADDVIRDFWRGHLDEWERFQRHGNDELVWMLAKDALVRLRPRLMLVNFQDVDYAHWGLPYLYTRGLERTDTYTADLFRFLRDDPFYRDDTFVFLVPDCGRDRNPRRYLSFQHHMRDAPGANEIFIFVAGPGVPRGARVDRLRQQIDLAPTIARLLDLPHHDFEGEPLAELYG